MTQAQTQSLRPAAGPTTPNAHSDKHQTFLDHLHELRRRFFAVALTLLGGTLLGYALHDQVIHALLQPLNEQKLIYLTPGGGFDFIFKVSLYVGAAVTIPVAVYQLYKYLAPLMVNRTRRFAVMIMVLSCLFALGGMAFGYFVALPAALQFLTGFAGEYVEASLTASSYLGFVTAYSLGLAVLFQIPLILLLINAINGPLKPSKLFSIEPYVLLGAVVLAAIITPTPDITNQAIVAGPIILMYQIGIGMVVLQNRSRHPQPQPTAAITFVARPQTPLAEAQVMPKASTAQPSRPRSQPTFRLTMDGFARPVQRSAPKPPARATVRRVQPPRPRYPARSIDGFAVGPQRQAIDIIGGKT